MRDVDHLLFNTIYERCIKFWRKGCHCERMSIDVVIIKDKEDMPYNLKTGTLYNRGTTNDPKYNIISDSDISVAKSPLRSNNCMNLRTYHWFELF